LKSVTGMRSLATKLTLAFLAVGLMGAVLLAFFVALSTQREFDQFVANRDRYTFNSLLGEYYETNGNWQGVETVLESGRFPVPGQGGRWGPLSLVNAQGYVVSGKGRYTPGKQVSATELDKGVPIKANGQVVGWLLFEPRFTPLSPESPEAEFLSRMTRAITYSALGAVGLALLLGALLARTLTRPIRELTDATKAVARGELGQQVSVRTHDELGELAASFNQMSADLADSIWQRRQMTADIAHDLRTPLSVILGYTEALRDGKLQATPETFGIMHEEARHLSHLIDDLRTLSLADAGELPLTRQSVAPRELLNRAAAAHSTQAARNKVEIVVRAADDLPRVWIDPERMIQVLGNLLSNALRYTPSGGRIEISAVQRTVPGENPALQLQVRDNGSGISPADLPHIFERFYRGDTARSQSGESGLGLAIARSLVEMHGGQISAESAPREGTTITILLPWPNPAEDDMGQASARTGPAGASA
jgi:signal transduction histidine kinase